MEQGKRHEPELLHVVTAEHVGSTASRARKTPLAPIDTGISKKSPQKSPPRSLPPLQAGALAPWAQEGSPGTHMRTLSHMHTSDATATVSDALRLVSDVKKIYGSPTAARSPTLNAQKLPTHHTEAMAALFSDKGAVGKNRSGGAALAVPRRVLFGGAAGGGLGVRTGGGAAMRSDEKTGQSDVKAMIGALKWQDAVCVA